MHWLLSGGEAVAGVAVVAATWILLRALQGSKMTRRPSALGMALLPVSLLVAVVVGIVLILDGVGAL
jgi:hypothetical protein